jgi:hypothetical protein
MFANGIRLKCRFNAFLACVSGALAFTVKLLKKKKGGVRGHLYTMEKKYIIEQFPKNKDTDAKLLSDEMKLIRANKKKIKYGKTKKCNKCFKTLPIKEFYFANKETGRRKLFCRDCQMTHYDNVTEIGKMRFSIEILKKGFRRCGICKDILPLDNFRKSKKYFGGHFHNCISCDKEYYISKHCTKNNIDRSSYDETKFINRSEAQTKGKIKITNLKTNEVFYFNNTKDDGIRVFCSHRTINVALKRIGGVVNGSHTSICKDPFKVERI